MIANKAKPGLRRLLAVLAFLALSRPAGAGEGDGLVFLKPNGHHYAPYHADEAPTEGQGGWLALVREKDGWHLRETSFQAERARDELLDYEGEPPTGVIIHSREYPESFALLRHPALKAGAVEGPETLWEPAAEPDLHPQLPPRRQLHSFRLAGRDYWLELWRHDYGYSTTTTPDKLFLNSSAPPERQLLPEDFRTDEDNWPVNVAVKNIWIGDLDGDNLPDFIIWNTGYNHDRHCLYLSTVSPPAADGALPTPTACHLMITGC